MKLKTKGQTRKGKKLKLIGLTNKTRNLDYKAGIIQ